MPKRTLSVSSTTPKKKRVADETELEADMEPVKCSETRNRSAGSTTGDRFQVEFFGVFDTICADNGPLPKDADKRVSAALSKLGYEDLAERKMAMDQYLRNYLLDVVTSSTRSIWNSFLEMSIAFAKKDLCSPSILFTLISDLMELSSLQESQEVFDFVENRLDIWKEPLFLNSGKTAVLRLCNDLLRRLSRAQNTIYCGKILIFLSNYFPFSERSALNIMSDFNNDNVTEYKLSDGQDDPDDQMDASDEKPDGMFEGLDLNIPGLDKIIVETQEEKRNKTKVDYNLYVKFWSLQEFFRSPNKVYEKVVWKTFGMYINDVLSVFHFFKMDCGTGVNKQQCLRKRKSFEEQTAFVRNVLLSEIPKLTDESLYFAKYLTNRRLLELQMNDPSFRRYFLVQLLIILQYLTATVKFKNEGQVLSEEQIDFIRKTETKVYRLLEESPYDGIQFVKAVKHVLSREVLWNQWKNEGCQPFSKPGAPTSANRTDDSINAEDDKGLKKTNSGEEPSKETRRRHLGDIVQEASLTGKYLMGNSELTRLWNISSSNLEACRSQKRDFTPTIESFFADALKEIDNDHGNSESKKATSKKLLGNPNYGWRALRLLASKSPYFFQMFGGAPVTPLPNYLEFLLKKIQVDLEGAQTQQTPERLDKTTARKEQNLESTNGAKKHECDNEAEMEEDIEEDDEMINQQYEDEDDDGDEDQYQNPNLRKLTTEEMKAVSAALGPIWKDLAAKLQFKADEISYFEEAPDCEDPCLYMLTRWTEQEGDEATVADLLYILQGLGVDQGSLKIFDTVADAQI